MLASLPLNMRRTPKLSVAVLRPDAKAGGPQRLRGACRINLGFELDFYAICLSASGSGSTNFGDTVSEPVR